MNRVLLFSGSLRKESLNKKLIKCAGNLISSENLAETQIIDLQLLSIPVYDGDIESAGIPEGVLKLAREVADANALIISSPEYNGSIAGSLKNTIDWLSRVNPNPLTGKAVLLMGASPGYFGAIRALSTSKLPFEALGCFVYPQTFALPNAHKAFSENDLLDEATTKKLLTLLVSFNQFAEKIKKSPNS